MARRSRDWNEGLAEDLQDADFSRCSGVSLIRSITHLCADGTEDSRSPFRFTSMPNASAQPRAAPAG
jgi:hypothetical protein